MKHNSLESKRTWSTGITCIIIIIAAIMVGITGFADDDSDWAVVQSGMAALALIVVALSLINTNPIINSPDTEYASRAMARHMRRVEQAFPGTNIDCIKPPDDIRLNALRPSTLAAWDRYLSVFYACWKDGRLSHDLESAIKCLRSELMYYRNSLGSDLE